MPLDHQIPNTIPIVGTIAPAASADTYPITNPTYGLGGFRTVTYAYELTSIPMPRRELGMVCYVSEQGQYYALSGTTADTGWTPWPNIDVNITNIVNNEYLYTNNVIGNFLERAWYLNTGIKNPEGYPWPVNVMNAPYPLSGAWLSAFNNQQTVNGPYNVINTGVDLSANYIPIDLTKGTTMILTVSSPDYTTATYKGFVLINNVDVVSSGDVFTSNAQSINSITLSTYEPAPEWADKVFTLTVYLQHKEVLADLPLTLYNANIYIGSNGTATQVTVNELDVRWSGGLPPAITDAPNSPTYTLGSEDIYMFTTRDSGRTWYGFVGGLNFS